MPTPVAPLRVLVASDGVGGTGPVAVTAALARGWSGARPDDEVAEVPVSAGGPGMLDAVVAGTSARVRTCAVADATGLPREARWCVLADGTAVVEAAAATAHAGDAADPTGTTSWGVGQLLEEARRSGATRLDVGAGGGLVADGGAGALVALGLRLRVADGQGLRVGGGNVAGLARIERGWAAGWGEVAVRALADTGASLLDAASRLEPHEDEDPDVPVALAAGLRRLAAVASSDLPLPGLGPPAPHGGARDVASLVDAAGGGAGGGLAFALAAALGASIDDGARVVADVLDLPRHVGEADVVVGLVGPPARGVVPGAPTAARHLVDLAARSGRGCVLLVARGSGGATAVPIGEGVEVAPVVVEVDARRGDVEAWAAAAGAAAAEAAARTTGTP